MDLMDYRRKIIANSPHLKSASGDIVSFSDGADLPLKSLNVDIEPVQDLHGYDSPWVGGGGKNLIDVQNVQLPMADNYFCALDLGGDVTFSSLCLSFLANNVFFTSNNAAIVDFRKNDGTHQYRTAVSTGMRDNQSNTGVYVKTETNITFSGLYLYLGSGYSAFTGGTMSVQLEKGSTATAFAPYENICPISGWNGVKVTRAGKNLLDLSNLRKGNFSGATNNTNVSFDEYQPIKGGQTYVWSSPLSDISGRYLRFYDEGKIELSSNVNLYGTGVKTFSVPSNARYFRCMWYRTTGIEPTDIVADQIELGSTATPYEPYNGVNVSVDLGQTVYGGTLNPLTGVLTVDRQFFELDGNTGLTRSSSGASSAGEAYPYWVLFRFACSTTTNYSAWRFSHGLCVKEAYAGIFRTYQYSATHIGVVIGTDSNLSSGSAVKSWLQTQKDNGTPLQIVAELATPFEIQLTPHQIRSLYGNNTIFADTGNVALEYWARP